ncbi:MAG: hypothetical protein IPM69_01625 [Ignavibacteria bacterium]|nr:hypothetical protein [Ignavibacteria bacterium]
MKRIHDKIDKTSAPKAGESYIVHHNNEPLYSAEVIEYKGGCWAKLKIDQALNPEFKTLYHQGDIFDVKIAMYEFEAVESELS